MSRSSAFLSLILLGGLPLAAVAQQPAAHVPDGVAEVESAALQWSPLELPGFAPGTSLVVIHGDPSRNEAYTIRLRFPDGYEFPSHYHPNAENLTVLSGRFLLGHGTVANRDAVKAYVPGDFLYIPGGMPHYGRVEGETVIQLHGMGPFDVKLAQPAGGTQR